MNNRSNNKLGDPSSNQKQGTRSRKRSVTFKSIQDKEPDRTFYLKDKARKLSNMVKSAAKDLYHSLSMTFSMDSLDFHNYKKIIWPMISSGAAFIIGEYLTTQMSRAYSENDDYDYVFKFLLGSAILGYCATQRITEKRLQSPAEISAAVASEVLAITYLYTSTFRGSQTLLKGTLSDNYSLIASLGTSSLLMPASISYIARKLQEKFVKKLYVQGAQRSDTAAISSGMTSVSNIYFQANHFLTSELLTSSRLFQLGLISDNILNAQRILQRFRNLPALIADAGPAAIKNLITQQEKLETDYKYNTATEKVLRFTKNGAEFFQVPRYKLRNGDLVYCDKAFDLSSVPVSGELVALTRDEKGNFTQNIEQKKFSVNLKAHNGEDVWIELKSNAQFTSNYKQVDLHAIHDGKQAGVLAGDKLNLYGDENFFIQIKAEKEHILINNYEKKSVINQIITERKQKNILFSILVSIVMAGFLNRDITQLPAESLRLLFNLFQMMIPFSETFLREMVNSGLMKDINESLTKHPMETIDALRIVDLCNAISGYYQERFPKGVTIVSDKTGTLTTTKMNVLGFWTTEMKPDVQALVKENDVLLPDKKKQNECFEIFASAYTNEKKELEPEEFAILQLLKSLQDKNDCLTITVKGNNHFQKTLLVSDGLKEIETFHLGLFRSFGGRLTLVDDGKQKYLVFCGVPKRDKFQDTQLFTSYTTMQTRTGVLSRDWCIAHTPISDEKFATLKALFAEDKKSDIEQFILSDPELLKALSHDCTFIVNNPVKKGAEKFISQCKNLDVPIFVATGDTAKASENIAHVLFPTNTAKIITIHATDMNSSNINQILKTENLADATIIFVGVTKETLNIFKSILEIDKARRPIVIFSEMSTEGKGVLTEYLKNNGYFVVANGDGTNDIMMMKNADVVISHLNDEATHAPGVEQLSNLNDKQLQRLLNSDKGFYELFDMQQGSPFIQTFTPLANSQEKPSVALALKSSKMGFEVARNVGVTDVKDMAQQHWFGVAFDLLWVWISFQTINSTTDLPLDKQNLNQSNFINKCLLTAMAMAFLQALATYALSGESTNLPCMLIILTALPVVLKSIFSGYGEVQNELHPIHPVPLEIEEEQHNASLGRSIINFFGSFFHKHPTSRGLIDNAHEPSDVLKPL